jgi:hypothetical protein
MTSEELLTLQGIIIPFRCMEDHESDGRDTLLNIDPSQSAYRSTLVWWSRGAPG